MWRGPRSAPEGQPQSAFGMSESGQVFEISEGDGWQRNLGNPAGQRVLVATACVNTYVSALSACGIEHVKLEEDGEIEVVENSAVTRLLRYPNFLQQQAQFVATVVSSLMYTGNAYIYANKRNGRNEITELTPLTSDFNRGVLNADGTEVFFDVSYDRRFFAGQDTSVLVPSRDMGHCKLATARSLIRGESFLSDASYTLALNQSIMSSSTTFISNMSRPSGIIGLDTDVPLTATQMNELRAKFIELTTGNNKGGIPILGSNAKFYPMTITAVDAQVMQMYEMTALDICRAYRVPIQLVGQLNTHATSTLEQLMNQWRASGLLYVAETIERTLERLFDLPPNEEIRFDLDNIMRADTKTQMEVLAKAVQNGIYSPNEARAKVGKSKVPFGDEPRVQAQNVRLEDAVPAPSAPSAGKAPAAPAEDPAEPDDEPTKKLTDEEVEGLTFLAIQKAIGEYNDS